MLFEIAAQALSPYLILPEDEIVRLLEIPPRPELGDVAFPCFTLAKVFSKSPVQIAAELSERIEVDGWKVSASGPYVNLFVDRTIYVPKWLDLLESPQFYDIKIGAGRRVVIDMSSPNIAKPFGIGHLRSTVIGAALYRMYEAAGYDVQSVNHLGDWGTQFGKQIAAYKRWGNDEALAQAPIKESLQLYVRFHAEAEQDPSLEIEARDWFRKLEQGDEEATQLWRYFVEISMQEFNRMYDRLGVSFDHVLGESFYNDQISTVIENLRQLSLLEESEGALVVRLNEEGLPPCLILKSDGTTIYTARDIATAIYRHDVMRADQMLYVVGAEQILHFEQVFAVLRKMGAEWINGCVHIPFGMMRFEGKKMSTRRGKVVFLDDVLDEAVAKANEIIEAKSPDLEQRQEVAEAIGIGAIIFGDLKNNRMNEVGFSLEDAIHFEGETGPYVQYAYARTQAVLEKANASSEIKCKVQLEDCDASGDELVGTAGFELLKLLTQYPEVLKRGIERNEPSVVARYLLDVAKSFNQFYNKEKIIHPDPQVREARIRLTSLTAACLSRMLHMLGLHAPNRI